MCIEVTLVLQCSQLVCVIACYSFVAFQFFIILTINERIIVVLVLYQYHCPSR